MYKIIGADEKEYGPVTAEQLRDWVVQGRANGSTMVQLVGTDAWRSLSTYPELNLPPHPLPRLGSPPPAPDAEQLAADILARDYQLDVGRCVGRAWGLVMQDFWLTLGVGLVAMFIAGAVGLLAFPMLGGVYYFFLKRLRGQTPEFGDVFAGFSLAFLGLFLAGLVMNILIVLGLFLCILPGIYLAVCWKFTIPLIVDKRLDFWPAMELSRKVVSRHWWQLFWLAIVNILIILLGCLVCVGYFIAVPVTIAACAVAYDDIFNQSGARPGF